MFRDVDGRRRYQAWHLNRTDRRLLLQRGGRFSADPRPAGDHPELPGRGPYQADLQVPGAGFPPDRRCGQAGDEGAGLVACRREFITTQTELLSREPMTLLTFSCFLHIQPAVFQAPDKAVILSVALRRSIANGGLYGAESKDPGDACWQMLLGAFWPQTTTEFKKVTNSDRSDLSRLAVEAVWRDLLFSPPTPILSSVTFSLRHSTSAASSGETLP